MAGRKPAQDRDLEEAPNFVDAFVETLKYRPDRNSENLADPEQSCHGNRSASFDLLPVPGRKAEGDHVFLVEAVLPP